MPAGIGYSFQPGVTDQPFGGPGVSRTLPPPDSAVKVLSFRLPKREIPGALAPSALLNSPGMAGAQTGGLTPQLLAMLMQAFAAPSRQGGPFGGGVGSAGTAVAGSTPPATPSAPPPPRIIPGEGGPRTPIPPGGGTDTFSGWLNNEQNLGMAPFGLPGGGSFF